MAKQIKKTIVLTFFILLLSFWFCTLQTGDAVILYSIYWYPNLYTVCFLSTGSLSDRSRRVWDARWKHHSAEEKHAGLLINWFTT